MTCVLKIFQLWRLACFKRIFLVIAAVMVILSASHLSCVEVNSESSGHGGIRFPISSGL